MQDAEEAVGKAEAAQKRAADIASGAVQMNGRELFQHEPWVFDNNIYWGGEMKPWELLRAWFVLPHGKL